jgi:parvulin-like peptidyl-prolyl isomerase
MKKWIAVYLIFFIVIIISGCANKKVKNEDDANRAQSISSDYIYGSSEANSKDILVNVDGKYLKKSQLEKEMKEFMNVNKNKIPIGINKIEDFEVNIKEQLVENFITNTVLENEIEKRKIQATEQEISELLEQTKANLPPDMAIADFMKQNRLTKDKFNEYIVFSIKVKKIVQIDLGDKAKPSAKEISKFYNDNIDRYVVPETVFVRHILVAIEQGDDEKIKAEKKAKIENLRKQLMEGADFAEVARESSDDPSKYEGGELGLIKKGVTGKQFEDAAFSQENNVIGPVVTTERGYHIIKVTEHNKAKTITLAESKNEISNILEKQKQMEAFNSLVKKLRENAKIVIYEK